jgi:hypothetical protein
LLLVAVKAVGYNMDTGIVRKMEISGKYLGIV